MAESIIKKNLIHMNTPIKGAHPISKNNLNPYVELKDGTKIEYDHIISTMPIKN